MSIISTDIQFYLTGGAANSDPNLSLGGAISATLVGAGLNNLLDDVSPEEASAGDVEYRAINIKNTHATETLTAAVIWITAETTSTDTTIDIAYDATGTQSVANESTAPTGVTFSKPVSKATGISLGNIAASGTKRIWFKRTVTAGAVKLASDLGTIRVEGGTT